MDGAGRSEHRLVIVRRHDHGEAVILLLKERDAWTLPHVGLPEQRSADIAELNRAVRDALALETSVLGCLADEPGAGGPRRHLQVLEAHGGAGPAAGRWVTVDAARAALPPDSDAWKSVEAWIRSAAAIGAPEAREWVQPGWRDEVLAWVAEQLDRLGWPPVSAVEQVRVWEFSQVLVLDTAGGRFYFKARPASGAHEAPLTKRLAERHPPSTPHVIAIEPDRHWLLMRATAGPELMEVRDLARWAAATATIAGMQIDWLGSVDELAALGCRRHSLAELEAEIGALIDDAALLQPLRADGLHDAEVAALHRRRPEIEALCRELGGHGVPSSLEHGDLWAANIIAAEGANVLIDWEDAAVAHPFFTPALLLLSLHYTDALTHVPDARRRLREAYLHPWTERGPLARWAPRRLEQVFDLAERVATFHYAAQFRRSALLIETSWEVRAFAPLFLRRFLEGA